LILIVEEAIKVEVFAIEGRGMIVVVVLGIRV
jgi:hypothetical protein